MGAYAQQLERAKSAHREYSSIADNRYREYTAMKRSADLAKLKVIYFEALERGKSLDWAEGRAEGEYLKPEDFKDELSNIIEIFRLCDTNTD